VPPSLQRVIQPCHWLLPTVTPLQPSAGSSLYRVRQNFAGHPHGARPRYRRLRLRTAGLPAALIRPYTSTQRRHHGARFGGVDGVSGSAPGPMRLRALFEASKAKSARAARAGLARAGRRGAPRACHIAAASELDLLRHVERRPHDGRVAAAADGRCQRGLRHARIGRTRSASRVGQAGLPRAAGRFSAVAQPTGCRRRGRERERCSGRRARAGSRGAARHQDEQHPRHCRSTPRVHWPS